MGKNSKNKMVVKQCPKCEQQTPVASKQCKCGHEFFSKRTVQSEDGGTCDEDGSGVKRRRTERVKRERPDYYSASEYENHLRRVRSAEKGEDSSKKKKKKHRRGRPKGSQNKSIEEIEEERERDLYSNLSRDRTLVYAVVLAEINERMHNQAWKPPTGPASDSPSSSGAPSKPTRTGAT